MNPQDPVFRIEQARKSGEWYVFGLNILGYNDVPGADPLGPFKAFMNAYVAAGTPSVLIGGAVVGYEDSPSMVGRDAVRTATTIFLGDISAEEDPDRRGYFFPAVGRDAEIDLWMDRYFEIDSMAVFLDVSDLQSMEHLLNSFVSGSDWERRLLDSARAVVVSYGDGQYLDVRSVDPHTDSLIIHCCQAADAYVKDTVWFLESAPDLEWVDDPSACYLLPAFRRPVSLTG